MEQNYCSIIHGGLFIIFNDNNVTANHCCLRTDLAPIDPVSFWNSEKFQKLREINQLGQWDSGCSNCQRLEASGQVSFRNGMNQGLGIFGKTNVSGPARIDLKFDRSCNLACRICGPDSSTLWQKHLKEHGQWQQPVSTPRSKKEVVDALSNLDLDNLNMLVFCGGETLLGQEYWDVAKWFTDTVPHAKERLTMCFQTNGTQTILSRNYKTIEKCHLVKLHVSIDGVGDKFEYMRWPASWSQLTDNLFDLRENLPSNVMFLVEETISIFNLAYLGELDNWVKSNYTTNKEGDPIVHTKHFVNGMYDIRNYLTQEYVDAMINSPYQNLIDPNWQEQPDKIQPMLAEIRRFDGYRNQDWTKTFPEVAEFYRRYL